MSKHTQTTINSSDTQRLTLQILSGLGLAVKSTLQSCVYHALLFSASRRFSIHQTCTQLDEMPTGATILSYLRSSTNNLERLERRINNILVQMLPKGFGRRGRYIAIDLITNPFHGTVEPEHEAEVTRSKAKSGTTHFFAYASAYAVVRGRRYTLALSRYTQNHSAYSILKKLVRRLLFLGIRIRLLLLDREFCNVKVLRYLQRGGYGFIIPMTKRGKKPGTEGGPTGTQALAMLKTSRWVYYTMSNSEGQSVEVAVAVVCINSMRRMKKVGRVTWLYAVGGVTDKPLTWIRELYRKRFGIEASYRQARKALIRTSSVHPGLRLLFMGLALILRNIWVWLHIEVIAMPNQKARVMFPDSFRLDKYLSWIMIEVIERYGLIREVYAHQDFEVRLELFFNY